MVYCCLVTTYTKPIDAIKSCVVDRGSGNSNEIIFLVGWIHRLGNDANSVAASQYYGASLSPIKRGKEVQEELWCTICRTDGHHKDNFLALMKYVTVGASNPINTQGIPWCRICQTRCHQSE